jgi:NADH-ubiquinone oxidoreductase chain 1
MTEHAAVVFVFFFLAEYGSIVLICTLSTILFLGGYLLLDLSDLFNLINYISYNIFSINIYHYLPYMGGFFFKNPTLEGLLYGLSIGLKSSFMIFVFI